MKSIRDLEDSFSDRCLWLSINRPCLLPGMYVIVFTLVRKRGVICATCIYKVITRHLNVECFDSTVPAIFLSYAPTFFSLIKHCDILACVLVSVWHETWGPWADGSPKRQFRAYRSLIAFPNLDTSYHIDASCKKKKWYNTSSMHAWRTPRS